MVMGGKKGGQLGKWGHNPKVPKRGCVPPGGPMKNLGKTTPPGTVWRGDRGGHDQQGQEKNYTAVGKWKKRETGVGLGRRWIKRSRKLLEILECLCEKKNELYRAGGGKVGKRKNQHPTPEKGGGAKKDGRCENYPKSKGGQKGKVRIPNVRQRGNRRRQGIGDETKQTKPSGGRTAQRGMLPFPVLYRCRKK